MNYGTPPVFKPPFLNVKMLELPSNTIPKSRSTGAIAQAQQSIRRDQRLGGHVNAVGRMNLVIGRRTSSLRDGTPIDRQNHVVNVIRHRPRSQAQLLEATAGKPDTCPIASRTVSLPV